MASHTRVLRDFGFNIPSGKTPDSLCAYAPVFRAGDSRGEWIVKRTQGPIARAQAVANWVRALAKEGVQEYIQWALPRLLRARLPLANCVWDYKASNLVFPSASSPVLVDPDSGGRIPRAYGLAIAALLFHNEGQGPGRLFTRREWGAFLGSYGRCVQLTEEEMREWEGLLLSAWVDEGLWLIREDSWGWQDLRQSQILTSLLTADLSELSPAR